MSKVVDDANALAAAASDLAAEVAAGESGTVTDKTVTKVTVCYSDGSSVDFTPAGETAPGVETPAPVVSPVTDSPTTGDESASGSAGEQPSETPQETPQELPEGASEVAPTVAGVVPE